MNSVPAHDEKQAFVIITVLLLLHGLRSASWRCRASGEPFTGASDDHNVWLTVARGVTD
jgi:hypothetical protein